MGTFVQCHVSWVPGNLYAKPNVDPFSRFCTAHPLDGQSDRLTDVGIIDHNSLHLMYLIKLMFQFAVEFVTNYT